jgi:hypothetical protein
MRKYQEKIFNIQTGETIFRDYTPEEIAQVEAEEAAAAEKLAELEAKAAAKAALLEKLGITEEEAKLLLGGN